MRFTTHTLLFGFAIILGLAAAGACYARPSWPQDLGLDFWSVPDLKAAIERDQRGIAELQDRMDATLRRIAVKEALARQLVAGRLTLRETAALFRHLDGGRPGYAQTMLWTNPGATLEECYCRAVIRYVEPGNPKGYRSREAAQRLEAELAGLVAHGGVTLPDAAEAAARLQ